VVLGEWTVTKIDLTEMDRVDPPGPYPIDPTGCFAIVDSDLGPGTRLVLLPE
jgi:hypothetical protein